jgi:hypothetical protein
MPPNAIHLEWGSCRRCGISTVVSTRTLQVHGLRCFDCRRALRGLAAGQAVVSGRLTALEQERQALKVRLAAIDAELTAKRAELRRVSHVFA